MVNGLFYCLYVIADLILIMVTRWAASASSCMLTPESIVTLLVIKYVYDDSSPHRGYASKQVSLYNSMVNVLFIIMIET